MSDLSQRVRKNVSDNNKINRDIGPLKDLISHF